ncbi:MAG: class I SAM-dependent methyltransferase, partial [Acidimicrobiia bacterium]|nr:class I SAM-dependent methyltransferase [Acidimicrobiia bacterium]
LARSGAKVIVVEPDPVALALVRDHGSEHGLTIETHDRDLAELAFVRAGTVDVALAVQSLVRVADPSRVFRQLHRVLRPDAALVASLPHPMRPVLGPPRHRYGQASPQRIVVASGRGDIVLQAHHHTTEALVAGLLRTNFALDALLEPVPDRPSAPDAYWDPACEGMPSALIVRARRLGR